MQTRARAMTGSSHVHAARACVCVRLGLAVVAALAVGCGDSVSTLQDAGTRRDSAQEAGLNPDTAFAGETIDLNADATDAQSDADAALDRADNLRSDTSSAEVRGADLDSSAGRNPDARPIDAGMCTGAGHVTYTLVKAANPTAAEQHAYDLIATAMDKATYYYNCATSITKALRVTYNPGVPTADGNINGSIRFGGTAYMEYETAMHEIAHTVGVGTAPNWFSFVAAPDGGSSGLWKGEHANAELRAITGNSTITLKADRQHFWPYGLNYAGEVKSDADAIAHCRIVAAIRKDLGL